MATHLSDISVLVVDDNEMNVDLLVNMLERYQYKIYSAMDGATALDLVAEKLPEVVLLDISMPIMDGYEVCRRIKANEVTRDIPVIFISALDDMSNVLEGFEVGGVDYITKPFKYREVIARIQTQVTLLRQKREIEELRERERKQYERMDALRRQFIGSATHDLKNPLFVISGYADMIEMVSKAANNTQVLGFVESIRRGVDKMSNLVYDILGLLQLETESTIDRQGVAFNQFVEQAVMDMKVRAEEKFITLTYHPPIEDIAILVDTKRIARVLDNLISNAIKYTSEHGHIDVVSKVGHDTVVIEVIDNGLGIPDDVQATIFEPFQRVNTEEHMTQEGTGLGLSIVKTLVEQHGGTISVESEIGQGSCFIVTLPIVKP
ncbi:MAG: hybrid sensor histidine kinase/response regulator [Phototrophicaceae bacterium]